MIRPIPAVIIGVVASGAIGAIGVRAFGIDLRLDRHLAYRSPFFDPSPPASPRALALADLERARLERAEAERRRAELLENLDTEIMVELGGEIVRGRGLCFNCHKLGEDGRGDQGPNLDGVGERAGERVEGMKGLDYLAQSLYEPDAFVVPGYAAGMVAVDGPPIALDALEILMVIAFLQSLGGEPTVDPDTRLSYWEASQESAPAPASP